MSSRVQANLSGYSPEHSILRSMIYEWADKELKGVGQSFVRLTIEKLDQITPMKGDFEFIFRRLNELSNENAILKELLFDRDEMLYGATDASEQSDAAAKMEFPVINNNIQSE